MNPLVELTLARLRSFWREPSAVFWTFGFPLVLTVALGVAFRNRPPDPVAAAVETRPGSEALAAALEKNAEVKVRRLDAADAREALRTGKVAVVVQAGESVAAGDLSPAGHPAEPGRPPPPGSLLPSLAITYELDPTRPESRLARALVDDTLQRALGRIDAAKVADAKITEPGSRYIDFLIPGLIGMTLMSSSMWGIGFVIVEMRVKKLMKRLVATPMRRSHFLASFILMRLLFVLLELPVLTFFGWATFGVGVRGSLPAFVSVSLLGAVAFGGLSLLIASRAQNEQTVNGLMNLVMLPMFMCSGVFFSTDKFPALMQPFLHALPLTALNDALRAVMIDGASFGGIARQLAILVGLTLVSFAAALRLFRWR